MANLKWQDSLGTYIGGIYPIGAHADAFRSILEEMRHSYRFSDKGEDTITRTLILLTDILRTHDDLDRKRRAAARAFGSFDRAITAMEETSFHDAVRPLPPITRAISALRWEKATLEQEPADATQWFDFIDDSWDRPRDPLQDLMYESPTLR